MIRYIPGLTKIVYQGQIDSTETKRNILMTIIKIKKSLNLIYFLQQIIIEIFKIYTFDFLLNLNQLLIMIMIWQPEQYLLIIFFAQRN